MRGVCFFQRQRSIEATWCMLGKGVAMILYCAFSTILRPITCLAERGDFASAEATGAFRSPWTFGYEYLDRGEPAKRAGALERRGVRWAGENGVMVDGMGFREGRMTADG